MSLIGAERSLARRGLGTYAMGFVYGLQPDSLFVVLPALTLPTRLATLSYVLMFVIGTVCAMAGYTLAIGNPISASLLSTSDDVLYFQERLLRSQFSVDRGSYSICQHLLPRWPSSLAYLFCFRV